jgi:hypothetical protein
MSANKGTQIDEREEHPENARFPISGPSDLDSNVTLES